MSQVQDGQFVQDPERPWITEARNHPSTLNWLSTLTNPGGRTSKLHFTRAWTLLFFIQFLVVVGFFGVSFVIGLAGGASDAIMDLGVYVIAAVFTIVPVLSLILHIRRLRDAGKSLVWGALLILPLVAGILMFSQGLAQKSAEYTALYEKRSEFLEDPQAWRDRQLEERRQAQAQRAQEAEAAASAPGPGTRPGTSPRRAGPGDAREGRANRGGRGGPSAPEVDMNQPLPNQTEFILRPNLMRIPMGVTIANTLIMLWSLLWLARQPSAALRD